MGEPWFKVRDLARKHGIVAFSSNYTLYGDMSNRVMSILREFAPRAEVYSIDECFLAVDDLSRLWPSPADMGQAIRSRILRDTALPVCVGFATSKTLSKLANHITKKSGEFSGVCDLSAIQAPDLDALLESIDVGEVWGVGGQISKRLRAMGIETVGALRRTPPAWLRSQFGVVMERTGRELQGQSCLSLEQVAPAKQEIISSRAFGTLILTLDELSEAVSSYTSRAAEKLRRQSSVCGAVHTFIMTNRFRENNDQYANGVTVGLRSPTSDTRWLIAAALAGLKRIYRPGYLYKKAGIALMAIHAQGSTQGMLFDAPPAAQATGKLMEVLDAVNARFGRDALAVASSGIDRTWSMRANQVTPRYTTRWNELPIVRAR